MKLSGRRRLPAQKCQGTRTAGMRVGGVHKSQLGLLLRTPPTLTLLSLVVDLVAWQQRMPYYQRWVQMRESRYLDCPGFKYRHTIVANSA